MNLIRNSGRILMAVLVVSLLGSAPAFAQLGQVSIDGITNIRNASTLVAGNTHQVSIRYDFTELSNPSNWVGANGYEVYSPDGADWGYLHLLPGPLTTQLTHPATNVTIRHFNSPDRNTWFMTDNDGADPAGGYAGPGSGVGAYLAVINTLGMEGWIGGEDNDIAVILEFGSSVSDANQGKHICVDTTRQFVAWEWAAGAFPNFPRWDNGLGQSAPRCWEVWYPLVPEWCEPTLTHELTFDYCEPAEYQICAGSNTGVIEFQILPPHNYGDLGTVDPETGLWQIPAWTAKPGVYDLQIQVSNEVGAAPDLFNLTLNITAETCDCCTGRVGNTNLSEDDEPTIGDIVDIVSFLFLSRNPLPCLTEADVNLSGAPYPLREDISLGDISALVDYLFITGPQDGHLLDCP